MNPAQTIQVKESVITGIYDISAHTASEMQDLKMQQIKMFSDIICLQKDIKCLKSDMLKLMKDHAGLMADLVAIRTDARQRQAKLVTEDFL